MEYVRFPLSLLVFCLFLHGYVHATPDMITTLPQDSRVEQWRKDLRENLRTPKQQANPNENARHAYNQLHLFAAQQAMLVHNQMKEFEKTNPKTASTATLKAATMAIRDSMVRYYDAMSGLKAFYEHFDRNAPMHKNSTVTQLWKAAGDLISNFYKETPTSKGRLVRPSNSQLRAAHNKFGENLQRLFTAVHAKKFNFGPVLSRADIERMQQALQQRAGTDKPQGGRAAPPQQTVGRDGPTRGKKGGAKAQPPIKPLGSGPAGSDVTPQTFKPWITR